MRIALIVILIIVIIYLSVQVYFIFRERNQLKEQLANISRRVDSLSEENRRIKSEIDYFSIQENIEKELRARFNYIKTGEKMMIIVP